jgi:hypoxanthine phosphoribosyltransferase
MESVIIDFDQFRELSYKLLEEIRAAGKEYDAVLCPLRGGYYLSYFMSKRLGIPLQYIEISSYEKTEQKEFRVGIRSGLAAARFLLCDDIYDSGRTIRKIHSLYPHITFDAACLVTKAGDAGIYYGRYVEHDVWVNFFWETM